MPAHEYLALTSTCTHLRSLKNEKTTQEKREKSKTRIDDYYDERMGYSDCYYVLPNGEIDGLHIRENYDNYYRTTETIYVNGKRHGICQVYWGNKLFQQGEYVDDMREGVWETFCGDGELCAHTNYHRGKKDGICEDWVCGNEEYEGFWRTWYYVDGAEINSPYNGLFP